MGKRGARSACLLDGLCVCMHVCVRGWVMAASRADNQSDLQAERLGCPSLPFPALPCPTVTHSAARQQEAAGRRLLLLAPGSPGALPAGAAPASRLLAAVPPPPLLSTGRAELGAGGAVPVQLLWRPLALAGLTLVGRLQAPLPLACRPERQAAVLPVWVLRAVQQCFPLPPLTPPSACAGQVEPAAA